LGIDRKGDGHLRGHAVVVDGAVECGDRCPGVLGVEGLGGLGPVDGAVDGPVDGANLNRPCLVGPAEATRIQGVSLLGIEWKRLNSSSGMEYAWFFILIVKLILVDAGTNYWKIHVFFPKEFHILVCNIL
jgi:hypothetical protein